MANRKSPDGWLSNVKNGHGCEVKMIETKYESFEEYWMMGRCLCEGRPLILNSRQVFVLNKNWLDIFVREGMARVSRWRSANNLTGALEAKCYFTRLLDIPKKFHGCKNLTSLSMIWKKAIPSLVALTGTN